MIAYLDNASTTRPSEAAIAASLDALTVNYGNPSSAHRMGQDAERVVKRARRALAEAVGARPGQILFTGSGTESDNLALRAALRDPDRASDVAIFISSVEHPAVREPASRLAKLGARLTVIPVDGSGAIAADALERALEDALGRGDVRRALISVMHVNNELGVIQPIGEIVRVKTRIAERTGAEIFLHTDAVQSFLKLPADVAAASGAGGFAGVDLLSLSAHKAHGPKGVGALYASRPEKLTPIVSGGGQEGGARSGTENVPGVAGFGAAVAERGGTKEDILEAGERAASLRARLLRGVRDLIPDARINSPEEASVSGEAGLCSPYILNVSFPGARGEVILRDLERSGVFVSTGSACSNIGKSVKRMNPVLAAIGLSREEAEGAIRFSLSRYTSENEIDYAVARTGDAVARFRRTGTRG